MRQRDDGKECSTCHNSLWVCEKHWVPACVECNDDSMPCPTCNVGLARGGPEYDFRSRTASDTTLDTSGISQRPNLTIVNK